MRTILLVGEDALLVESRALLLRSTGAETVTVSSYQFARQSTADRVDLVVLCHTIPADVRSAICEDARRRWTDVRVIQVLKNEFEWHPTLRYADGIVLSGDPAKLIRCASELLSRSVQLRAPALRDARASASSSLSS
jgi:CheY-like chemotaxis protein